jgi:hypothetical protein
VASIAESEGGGQAATATPTSVSIAVGATAHFVLEFADIPSGATACPSVSQLAVELPNAAGSVSQSLNPAIQPCPPTFYVGAVESGS